MITPKLEELILKGRAFFKTFVAGGGQKNTLRIQEDRFIIITDLTYFPMFIKTNSIDNHSTQVSIYGDRGFNHYVFRNFVSHDSNKHQNTGAICVNTYLMHTESVGFSFSNAPYLATSFPGIASEDNPGYAPPLEYGKAGLTGSLPVAVNADTSIGAGYFNNYTTRPVAGNTESNQLQFPVDTDTAINPLLLQDEFDYPLMLVNYVEILGLPNNLGI